jgi:hypothetical protein
MRPRLIAVLGLPFGVVLTSEGLGFQRVPTGNPIVAVSGGG